MNNENNMGENQNNSVAEQQLQNNNAQRHRPNMAAQNLARRGLNAATRGAWDKARNAPIIGNAAKRAEDKLGNSKLANKLTNKNNHEKPNLGAPTNDTNANNPKSNEVGSRNLKNSLANKAKNLFGQRKKKKENLNKETTGKSPNETNSDSQEDNNSTSDVKNGVLKIKRTVLLVNIIAIVVISFMIIVIILSLILAVTGVNLAKTLPAIGSSTYGSDNFQSTYEEGTNDYKNEIKYYKKLEEVKKEYEKDHTDELNTNYIHAILIYKYYNEEIRDQNEEGEYIPIDFSKMTENVDTFYKLITTTSSSESKEKINYDIGGTFYNNLKNSSDFRSYYSNLLKEKNIDELLGEIFDFAKEISEFDNYDDTTITSETNVSVPTSTGSSNTNKTSMSINEYLSGSIYANTSNLSNPEKIKAYTIAYSTNIVAENKKLTVNSNSASASNTTCSVSKGCSYDSNGNLVSGGGSRSSQNDYYYNGSYYYKKPLTTSEQNELNKTINSVFGNVLVNSSGTYPDLNISKLDGFGDGDYKTILKNAYGDYKYKNVGENSYVVDGSYGDKKVLTEVTFYDQKSYSSNRFCGIKGYTIGGSGCGVTAMAIVASTYENNKKYDPIYMNDDARKRGLCGTSGTSQSFFAKEASVMKYKYMGGSKYNKSLLNSVLKHLAQGDLVVVRIGSGHFTSGGHYMVLGGIDPETKKVYVYDPNNSSNKKYRKTGNGWYSFNDIIVKEAYNFYIIWKG